MVIDPLQFWGKAQAASDEGPRWHPLPYHMLDVAAVAQRLLEVRPHTLSRSSALLGVGLAEAKQLIPFVAALHDLGKFGRAFQAKAPEFWSEGSVGAVLPRFDPNARHDAEGWLAIDNEDESLCDLIMPAVWPAGRVPLRLLLRASVAHHGRPISVLTSKENFAFQFRLQFGDSGAQALKACVTEFAKLLCPTPVTSAPISDGAARRAMWWVAGLVTLADWIGSSQEWFPYHAPDLSLEEYWSKALAQAQCAVAEAGVSEARPAARMGACELCAIDRPTPAQAWAESVDLPAGPLLIILEDVTGAGKTEAAQVLVHRLMAEGRASGAFWAMPTQATANAMYARQEKAIERLFASGEAPSLSLAHGQSRLSQAFQASILRSARVEQGYSASADDAERSASTACSAFLGHDRRMSLLADIGAGTIDQALLGSLPTKFNTMRLFGLAGKVLVLDEAHAYDAYMSAEIEALLKFQAALGGCVIILSATLPQSKRSDFCSAWQEGLGRITARVAQSGDYPLATIVSADGVVEAKVEAAPWSRRNVPVRLLQSEEDAVQAIVAAQKAGAAVAWVRNTVDDALEAATVLQSRGIAVQIFHARFAQGDRQEREREILHLFGKDASPETRRGQVLIATQVVEQSLDLDFDLMVTDLAPIDLVVQRAGRLRRHPFRDASRPVDVPFELLVVSPEPVEAPTADWFSKSFPRGKYVYTNPSVLWRSARILKQASSISTPDSLRTMIEFVYGPDAQTPPDLEDATARSMGKEMAGEAVAQQFSLKPGDGYDGGSITWMSEIRVRTRLGDEDAVVRFARMDKQGRLCPWYPARGTEWSGPSWIAWALSEAKVAAWRIQGASVDPKFAAAVNSVRQGWSEFEAAIPVVVLQEIDPQTFEGKLVKGGGDEIVIRYGAKVGMTFVPSRRRT